MTEIKNLSGLKPLGHAVLVKPHFVEERTSGGIILPSDVRTKDQFAEQKAVVVEIGKFAWSNEPEPRAKVGDCIMFTKWAGYQAVGVADGEVYRVVNDSDIFLKVTGE